MKNKIIFVTNIKNFRDLRWFIDHLEKRGGTGREGGTLHDLKKACEYAVNNLDMNLKDICFGYAEQVGIIPSKKDIQTSSLLDIKKDCIFFDYQKMKRGEYPAKELQKGDYFNVYCIKKIDEEEEMELEKVKKIHDEIMESINNDIIETNTRIKKIKKEQFIADCIFYTVMSIILIIIFNMLIF